jgi:Integrase core domain
LSAKTRDGSTRIMRRLPVGSSSNTWWVSFAISIATRTAGDVVEGFEVMAGNLLWCELWQTHSEKHLSCLDLLSRRYDGAEFQSQFHWHLETRDIRHLYMRPRTPRLNGKVERSHRVDDQEFYQLLDKDGISDDIHLFNEKLREWEDYFNYHRPHGALDGQTPYERLLTKTRAEALPKS